MLNFSNIKLPALPVVTPTVAISACLMGEKVRYDGAHKASEQRHALAAHVTLAALCPEVAIGLGTPRPPIEQRWLQGRLAVVQVDAWQHDSSAALAAYAKRIAAQCKSHNISGYVLMPKSPSCALASSRVHDGEQEISGTAPGYFVRHLQALLPHLPMQEAPALATAQQLTSFLLQVHLYHRWQAAPPQTPAALQRFHQHHYLQLLATAPKTLQHLDEKLRRQPMWPGYLPAALALCAQPSTALQHRAALHAFLDDTTIDSLATLQQEAAHPGHSYFHLLPLFNVS